MDSPEPEHLAKTPDSDHGKDLDAVGLPPGFLGCDQGRGNASKRIEDMAQRFSILN